MAKGLTGSVIIGGLALLLYLFSKPGRDAGNKAFGYLQSQLDTLGGEEEEDDATQVPGGDSPTEEPEDPISPGTAPPAGGQEGPFVDPDTGAIPNRQQIPLVDDSPEPAVRAPSREDIPLFIPGTTYRGLGGKGPVGTPLNVEAFSKAGLSGIEQNILVSKFGATSPTSEPAQVAAERGYSGKEIIARFQERSVIKKPISKAPSPASQRDPAPIKTPVRASTPSLTRRVAEAEAEGRRQGQENPAVSRAPKKPALNQGREEILARLAGYKSQGRRGAF